MTRKTTWHIHVNTAVKISYIHFKDFKILHKNVSSECFLQHLWEFNLHINAVCWGGNNWCRNFLLGISLVLLGEAKKESHAWDIALNSRKGKKAPFITHDSIYKKCFHNALQDRVSYSTSNVNWSHLPLSPPLPPHKLPLYSCEAHLLPISTMVSGTLVQCNLALSVGLEPGRCAVLPLIDIS